MPLFVISWPCAQAYASVGVARLPLVNASNDQPVCTCTSPK